MRTVLDEVRAESRTIVYAQNKLLLESHTPRIIKKTNSGKIRR